MLRIVKYSTLFFLLANFCVPLHAQAMATGHGKMEVMDASGPIMECCSVAEQLENTRTAHVQQQKFQDILSVVLFRQRFFADDISDARLHDASLNRFESPGREYLARIVVKRE